MSGDTDASRGTRALAILDRVGEGVCAGLRALGMYSIHVAFAVAEPFCGGESTPRRVVRVNAVKRDRDAGGLTGPWPTQ